MECYHEPFAAGEGQLLRGPASTLALMRLVEPSPREWLEKWRQLKRLEINDRAMHELGTLVDALQAGGMFDCLNLPSLLSFEILARRIFQVTDAHAVPGRVSWANSKYFKGTASVDDIVPQEMRSYVHRESRAEVELAAARARQQSLAGGSAAAVSTADDEGGGAMLGDAPAAPFGKGAKKGGGRKGGHSSRQAVAAVPP